MNVYFINYHKFEGSSGIHIHFLANELVRQGASCTVVVPRDPSSVHSCGDVLYDCRTFSRMNWESLIRKSLLGGEQTVVHAWTPRDVVRSMTERVARRAGIPYFVHLEDNEEQIFESHLGVPVQDFQQLSLFRKLRMPKSLIHPKKYAPFMQNACGVTTIMDSLQEFVPTGVPCLTFWPACEDIFFDLPVEPDTAVRKELGISKEAHVITYTGNVHASNKAEVETLYKSVGEISSLGHDIVLLRCGVDHERLDVPESVFQKNVIELGNIPSKELYRYVSAASMLVQPGKPDVFNDYRFPSKIPMFLASGRPVVLPQTNIGKSLSNGDNCLLLKSGTVSELVRTMMLLVNNADLRRYIGQNGRVFARKAFDWKISANKVMDFYRNTK